VIDVNGTDYRLCLLDTNALSEMVKHPDVLIRYFRWAMSERPHFVPCFSPFSVVELRRRPDLFDAFLERFDAEVPCFLTKGYEWLLEEETNAYPDPSGIDPTALGFSPLGSDGNRLPKVYAAALSDSTFIEQERQWNENAASIVEGVTSLVANYPRSGSTYTSGEVSHFVFMAGFSQIAMRQNAFMKRSLDRGVALEIDSFPSVKAMTYTVFHKFYVDPGRKPVTSDAFDMIIAAEVPYVDAVVTENHQAEVLRKTKRLDSFIDHVRVFTLRDFRPGSPSVA
jgi:hypothetical protein